MRGRCGVAVWNCVGITVVTAALLAPTSATQAETEDCALRAVGAQLSDGGQLAGEVRTRSGEVSGRVNHHFPNGETLSIDPKTLACGISESGASARLVGDGTYGGARSDVLAEFLAGREGEDGRREGTYDLKVTETDSGRVVFNGNFQNHP